MPAGAVHEEPGGVHDVANVQPEPAQAPADLEAETARAAKPQRRRGNPDPRVVLRLQARAGNAAVSRYLQKEAAQRRRAPAPPSETRGPARISRFRIGEEEEPGLADTGVEGASGAVSAGQAAGDQKILGAPPAGGEAAGEASAGAGAVPAGQAAVAPTAAEAVGGGGAGGASGAAAEGAGASAGGAAGSAAEGAGAAAGAAGPAAVGASAAGGGAAGGAAGGAGAAAGAAASAAAGVSAAAGGAAGAAAEGAGAAAGGSVHEPAGTALATGAKAAEEMHHELTGASAAVAGAETGAHEAGGAAGTEHTTPGLEHAGVLEATVHQATEPVAEQAGTGGHAAAASVAGHAPGHEGGGDPGVPAEAADVLDVGAAETSAGGEGATSSGGGIGDLDMGGGSIDQNRMFEMLSKSQGPTLSRSPIDAPTAVPAAPALEMPQMEADGGVEGVSSGVSSAAAEVESAGSGGGGGIVGAIVDAAMSAFRGLVSGASGIARDAGGSVISAVTNVASTVFGGLTSAASGLASLVKSGIEGGLRGIGGAIDEVKTHVKGMVSGVLHRITGVIKPLAGTIKDVVVKFLTGRGGDVLFGITHPIRNAINSIVGSISGLVSSVTSRISNALSSAVQLLTGLVDRASQTVQNAIDAGTRAITGVIARVQGLVDRIPRDVDSHSGGIGGAIRSAISSLIDRLLAVVRRVANRILTLARSTLDRLQAQLHTIVEGIRQKVTGAIRLAEQTVRNVVRGAISLVTGFINRAVSFGRSIVERVTSGIRTLVKRLMAPIGRALMKLLLEWLTPKIKEAMANPKLQIPRTAPPQQQIESAAAQVPASLPSTGEQVLAGLLRPEGDHISIGISGSAGGLVPLGAVGPVPVGAGGQISGGWTLDFVADYRHGQLGLFLSPSVAISAIAGAGGGVAAEGDVNLGWGTVMTFGSAKNIKEGFGGAFFGVQAGGSASVDVGGGIGVSKGYNVYVSGHPIFGGGSTPGSTTPGTTTPGTTTPGTTTPGTTTPGTTTPGTPAQDADLPGATVFFDTGSAAVSPLDRGQIDAAVAAITARRAANPDATFNITVIGEASQRWQHPDKEGRVADNKKLSQDRANSVAAIVAGDLARAGLAPPVVTVSARGEGVSHAERDHQPTADNSQDYRDVRLTISEHIPGTPPVTTPPTTTPGTTTPGTTTPGTTTPGTAIPPETWDAPGAPFAPGTGDPGSQPTVGWDSTLGGGPSVGAGLKAGGYLGVNNSYSFMLWADNFGPLTMAFARAALGMYKTGMDVMTGDFPGLMRDVVGVIGPGIAALADEVSSAVDAYEIPVPPGGGIE